MPVVYRVDEFVVPEDCRELFWRNVRRTHDVLRRQWGFLDDVLLEMCAGTGRFNAVTMVRWESEEALLGGKRAIDEFHRVEDFRPADWFQAVGIEVDLANYVEVPADAPG